MIALLFTSFVAMLATSFGSSARTQMAVERDEGASVRAELAAQAGLDFARRQLYLDPVWNGVPEPGIALDGATSFLVTRLPGEVSAVAPTTVELVAEGRSATARFRLESEIHVVPGDELRTKVLAPLGEEVDVKYADIHGDISVPDKLGVVWDWNPRLNGGAGGWEPGGPDELEEFDFETTTLEGVLYKYTNTVYLGGAAERITTKPLRMPAWNLDPYLTPGPDRVILDGPESIQNQVFEQTVVIRPCPRRSWLLLDDNEFRGGLVVWAAADTDLRSVRPLEIRMQHQNRFGGGTRGIHPHIGLIAPTAEVRNISGLGQTYRGFNFWNEAEQDNWMDLYGQLVVVNEVEHIMHANLVFDPDVVANPPPGIQYAGPLPSVDVTVVRESYDPMPPP